MYNNDNWLDLNQLQIEHIADYHKRNHYLKLRKYFLKSVICPLLFELPLHTGFKFSAVDNYLSCRMMLSQILDEYQKRNYTRLEVLDIIKGRRVKRH